MGSSKTLFRRLLPRRAVREGDGDATVMPSWRDIVASIRAIISEDNRPLPADERATSESGAVLTDVPSPAPLRARTKAERNNRIVMILLGCDVLLGGAIGMIGFFGLESDGIALVGAAIATGGILLMLFFQLAGKER
jgi:hypothetical protein